MYVDMGGNEGRQTLTEGLKLCVLATLLRNDRLHRDVDGAMRPAIAASGFVAKYVRLICSCHKLPCISHNSDQSGPPGRWTLYKCHAIRNLAPPT